MADGSSEVKTAEINRLHTELASLTEVTTRKDRVIEEFQRRVETELSTVPSLWLARVATRLLAPFMQGGAPFRGEGR